MAHLEKNLLAHADFGDCASDALGPAAAIQHIPVGGAVPAGGGHFCEPAQRLHVCTLTDTPVACTVLIGIPIGTFDCALGEMGSC